MKFQNFIYSLALLVFASCSNNSLLVTGLEGVSKSIKTQYAPDKRVAIFDINFDNSDGKIIASGMTDSKEAYSKLLDSLKSLDVSIINNIRILPDTVVGNKMFAVARNSVINIRSAPKHSAELGTQGLLGMSLKILDKEGDFYRIQTPDNYISWVDKGGIHKMNEGEFDTWNASKKVIFTEAFGYVYASKNKNAAIISDITLGGLLKYLSEDANFYEVKYPDNRTGFIKKNETVVYENWLKELQPSKENIETVAKRLEGFPYLWGGTSSKGIDCSGFTKMVYLMNGFIIPRDASQQINAGKIVDADLTFNGLEKGDLLFFGTKATKTKKQRVVHVGIWLGNNKMEFIHASGNVHMSSMDTVQPNYDEFNKNRYLGSKRYLNVKDKDIIDLKEKIKM
ncbi:SH3 domain-containing C40 family peptidase [Polaribacter sp. PL03]|uniref:C40 family peptidase n=1 Tax=Polaribacter sp. PL03 TaxID=3088353 RepID=UPI0029CE2C58|nr:SH3 domain-containing C40 family peptidase [Polaribacter sp. PL03]MDX6746771.1 SH3 domain-containing C40 family peptidase [Polaribacter sp. PL03]